MNSMINGSKILAAALCTAVLAGCNAVEDVAEAPTAALPAETAVLGGLINDLGTRRPLVLQYNGTDSCLVPASTSNPGGPKVVAECQFLGVQDQKASIFSFGAIRVGTPYNITVKRQPFGKICTVQNPTGTVPSGGVDLTIDCVDDPAVARYTVTVNIAAAARSKADLQVVLTTENGTCPVAVNGRSVITFSPAECPNAGTTGYHQNAPYLFNSGTVNGLPRLPVFGWRVTATIPGENSLAPRTNCFVTGGPVTNTGGNINDTTNPPTVTTAPTASVNTINVVSCGFTVTIQGDYSRGPTEAADAVMALGDSILVALRSQPYGVDVASAKITDFTNVPVSFRVPDASGEPTSTVYEAQSDLNGFYELVIKRSPAGMACTPGFSTTAGTPNPNNIGVAAHSTRSVGSNTEGGAVLLRRPSTASTAQVWLIDKVIRCRLVSANPKPLRGTYWQYTTTTTTRTPITAGGTSSVVVSKVYNRNLLTFFEDGQYIYGTHPGNAGGDGVESGFYAYNHTAARLSSSNPAQYIEPKQMVFNGMIDINGGSGLHNGPGVARVLNNVVETAGPPRTFLADATSSTTNTAGLVLGGGSLTVSVGGLSATSVASGTYNTSGNVGTFNLATLVANINAAARTNANNPSLPNIAAVSGNEIQITGPINGVTFGGTAVGSLGLPASVPQGSTATSTAAGAFLSTNVLVQLKYTLTPVGPDTQVTTTNKLDGAWVAWDWQRTPAPVEDRRRIMVYQHGSYNVYHFGLNGFPNMQATCLAGNFALIGTWTRQGSGQGCQMRFDTETTTNGVGPVKTVTPAPPAAGLASGDNPNPNAATSLRDIPNRWPQSQTPSFTDGRPYSLVDYEVRLAGTQPSDPVCPNLDKLTVWDTVNGIHKDTLTPPVPRIVMCRIVPN